MQVAVFRIGSCLIALYSRRTLRYPGSHGFWRFFAFELLLALLVLNAPAWFRDPLGPTQIASWAVLVASALLAIHAFHVFHRMGGPRAAGQGADLAWERTTVLVTSGAYRCIRHPMYASLLLLAAGAMLKDVTLWAILLGFGVAGAIVLTARADERETAARFGRAYDEYRARTHMFIPWIV